MVIYSPLVMNFDVSFHLSFLAVVGIIYTQKHIEKIFLFLPETLAIREAFVMTLAALVFSLPIMIFNFGQVSLLAVFSNIAVTWTIPLAMLGGFISIIVDFISHQAAVYLSYFTWILLSWDIKVVHFFG
jgi:competence protein ComEC